MSVTKACNAASVGQGFKIIWTEVNIHSYADTLESNRLINGGNTPNNALTDGNHCEDGTLAKPAMTALVFYLIAYRTTLNLTQSESNVIMSFRVFRSLYTGIPVTTRSLLLTK